MNKRSKIQKKTQKNNLKIFKIAFEKKMISFMQNYKYNFLLLQELIEIDVCLEKDKGNQKHIKRILERKRLRLEQKEERKKDFFQKKSLHLRYYVNANLTAPKKLTF